MQICYRLGNGTIVCAEREGVFSIMTQEYNGSESVEVSAIEAEELIEAIRLAVEECTAAPGKKKK